jgi:hypothetical protein
MRTSAAAAALGALFLVVGCGGNGKEASPTQMQRATTGPEQPATGVQTPPQPPPPPSPPRPARVAVTVRDGAVVGGLRRVSVDRGRDVLLVVRADVRDHVHLHGYDLLTDVAPGSPGRIRFTADRPGRFEAELEERALEIAVLTVRR